MFSPLLLMGWSILLVGAVGARQTILGEKGRHRGEQGGDNSRGGGSEGGGGGGRGERWRKWVFKGPRSSL